MISLRGFRGGQYCFDMLIDIEALEGDFCTAIAAAISTGRRYKGMHSYDVPALLVESGAGERFTRHAISGASRFHAQITRARRGGSCCPFGSRSRFLFKMDFAEVSNTFRASAAAREGAFQLLREIAWEMKQQIGRNRAGISAAH